MRKITAIAVALGFLTSVSLPAFATPAANGVVKSDELSAKKKKKTEKKDEKKSALGDRPLRQEKEKDRKEGREEVRPRNDRPLRQEEKEDGEEGEKKSGLGATDLSAPRKRKRPTRRTRRSPRFSIASRLDRDFEFRISA